MGAAVTGCSTWLPAVYEIDVQQGNIVEQENLDRVQPGMTREQVRYLLGSPMIADPFRNDRWDYYYTLRTDGDMSERYRVTLFFEQDRLARLEGDRHPNPDAAANAAPREATTVVEVHPEPPKKRGIFTRMLEKIGIGT